MNRLAVEDSDNRINRQAFFQILLARSISCFKLVDKEEVCCDNIIYQVLSRVFSGIFHRNFNQYLNETRLDYARALLEYSNACIIDVTMDSGFESQRTFNRVFRERFRKTPKDYRQDVKKESGNE